jgi:predicted kinase
VFQLPYPDKLVGWQEKKIAEVSKLSEFAEIHQVPNFEGFKTALKEVLMAEREPEDTVDEECNQIELALQESATATFSYISGIIRRCLEESKRAVFILVGPQAVGKSFIVEKIIELFGEELIAICSADVHMGAKFNPMMLERVHKLCQMDCYKALEQGKFAIIDNTSMEAAHRTIYNHIATIEDSECHSVGVGSEFWMSEDEHISSKTVDVLEARAKKRAAETGRVIERYVIENAISKARADFAKFIKIPIGKRENVANWYEFYPDTGFPMGLSIDSSTLKFRSEELRKWCQVLFESYIWSGEAPDNITKMRLQYEIMRGRGDFYTTILNPNEMRTAMKDYKKKGEKFPNPSKIQISGTPSILGIGQVAAEDGKHAIFAVIDWEEAQLYRESLGFPRKHFHVTLAFEKDDVHRTSDGKEVKKNQVIFAM